MVAVAKSVGENRTRESAGRYYEDFEVGAIYEHRPGRTVSEADNTWFTLLTMNQHPLHFDFEYAKKSEFGRPLVNSCLTLSIVVGMSVSDISQKAIGNLGWNDIRLVAPVFIGDTIYAESEVLSKRESAKRPTQGVVTVRTTGRKADGTVFMTFERTVLVPKQGSPLQPHTGSTARPVDKRSRSSERKLTKHRDRRASVRARHTGGSACSSRELLPLSPARCCGLAVLPPQ
jgi:itaconyl-CoA hydratase